jgi:hypothetical protein
MTAITQTTFYNITCKICTVIRNAFVTAFVAIIAFGESAGRARAASELARQGYYKEAEALMLEPTKEKKNAL